MGDEKKPTEISGAITYPASHSGQQNVRQPRQPHSLQGLLRFAMESTENEDAPASSQYDTLDEQVKI